MVGSIVEEIKKDLVSPSGVAFRSTLPVVVEKVVQEICSGDADTCPPLGKGDGRASSGPAVVNKDELAAEEAKSELDAGDVVAIGGLVNAPSLNGLVGRVLGFDVHRKIQDTA